MKIEAKGWPAIIAMGIFTWPFWVIYGVVWVTTYLVVMLICAVILKPVELISNYIKRKHNESLQNQSNHQ